MEKHELVASLGARPYVTTFGCIALWNALPNGKKVSFYVITRFKKKHPE